MGTVEQWESEYFAESEWNCFSLLVTSGSTSHPHSYQPLHFIRSTQTFHQRLRIQITCRNRQTEVSFIVLYTRALRLSGEYRVQILTCSHLLNEKRNMYFLRIFSPIYFFRTQKGTLASIHDSPAVEFKIAHQRIINRLEYQSVFNLTVGKHCGRCDNGSQFSKIICNSSVFCFRGETEDFELSLQWIVFAKTRIEGSYFGKCRKYSRCESGAEETAESRGQKEEGNWIGQVGFFERKLFPLWFDMKKLKLTQKIAPVINLSNFSCWNNLLIRTTAFT